MITLNTPCSKFSDELFYILNKNQIISTLHKILCENVLMFGIFLIGAIYLKI